MSSVDFESEANVALLNPRLPAQTADRVRGWLRAGDHLTRHVFVLTSGSTAGSESDLKWVALSKQAVLSAAAGSNSILASDQRDVWLHCLPEFHVGGLGIWARAHLSAAKVVQFAGEKWEPKAFCASATEAGATLASLVPAQVFDVVEAGLPAPASLRAIVVGGAALPERSYEGARQLGWPLLPSYGMTEAASQIATAPLSTLDGPNEFPPLSVLPHLEVKVDPTDARISVRGASLLTGIVRANDSGQPEFIDPKDAEGWLATDDFGSLGAGGLRVTGRLQERVKIGGELVNLAVLRHLLEDEAAKLGISVKVALLAVPDARLGSVVILVAEDEEDSEQCAAVRAAYDARTMPYERIRSVRRISKIPRTELGKVKWAELAALVQAP